MTTAPAAAPRTATTHRIRCSARPCPVTPPTRRPVGYKYSIVPVRTMILGTAGAPSQPCVIGVEDLRRLVARPRLLERFDAKGGVQGVGVPQHRRARPQEAFTRGPTRRPDWPLPLVSEEAGWRWQRRWPRLPGSAHDLKGPGATDILYILDAENGKVVAISDHLGKEVYPAFFSAVPDEPFYYRKE